MTARFVPTRKSSRSPLRDAAVTGRAVPAVTSEMSYDPAEPEVVEAINTLAAQGDPPIDEDDIEADAADELGGEG